MAVDKPSIHLEQFIIDGDAAYGEPLHHFADLLVIIGEQFIVHAKQNSEFAPSHFAAAEDAKLGKERISVITETSNSGISSN